MRQEAAEYQECCCTDMRVETDLLMKSKTKKRQSAPSRLNKEKKLKKEHYTGGQNSSFY
jgi:hypothetical protein